ncbi:MAG TPA: YciI family protein [Vicinamibacterales bacterium]|nr:YciI family protein [Vicinamibacterales bacterium]
MAPFVRCTTLVLTLVALAVTARIGAQTPTASPQPAAAPAPPPDMRVYYMVFLRRGPAWTTAVTPETTKVNQGHRANIDRLTKEGLMVVAGPFEGTSGDRALAGIFILRVPSMEAATAAVETDPAVKAGRFIYEIVPWWGPATLRY